MGSGAARGVVAGGAAGFSVGALRTGLVFATDFLAFLRGVRFLVATFLAFSFPPARFLAVTFLVAFLGRTLAAVRGVPFLVRTFTFAFAFAFALLFGLADRLVFVALAIATLPV
jgi:hypothetical protein